MFEMQDLLSTFKCENLQNTFAQVWTNIFQQPFEHRIVITKTNNTGLLKKLKMSRKAENIFKR